jgi:hypothetical protein
MLTSKAIYTEYLTLARERAAAQCAPHRQPEDFGYDFRTWVSPYTKGAHRFGGLALVLQDWASADGLSGQLDPEIQFYGRTPTLLTNVRLERLLNNVLGVSLVDIYATNAFPFVKAGGMSAGLRSSDVLQAARQFVVRELELVKPTAVLALGAVAHLALRQCGVSCIRLPHPAARIGGLLRHEAAWRVALASSGVAVLGAN